MKFKSIYVSGALGGITLTTALGIEPLPENVVPPSAILERAGKQNSVAPEDPENLNVPFIGLSTAALPEMVAAHVGLEPNSALIVRMVMPGSPASKAGLSENDIILKIGDELVTQPEQLTSAILSRNVGERVDLSLIHKGKLSKVSVTLEARPAELAMNQGAEPMLDGLPKAHADRLRGLIERNLNNFGGIAGIQGDEGQLRMMREQMERALRNRSEKNGVRENGIQGNSGFEFQQNSTVRMMDGQGSVEIKSSGGSTEVTVLDQSRNILWSGPWDTTEDKAAAPDDIRARIESVHPGNANGRGFQFRFGKSGLKNGQIVPDTIDN